MRLALLALVLVPVGLTAACDGKLTTRASGVSGSSGASPEAPLEDARPDVLPENVSPPDGGAADSAIEAKPGDTASEGGIAEAGTHGVSCGTQCPPCLTCCGQGCVDTSTDQFNCGACGVTCEGDSPYCRGGRCSPAPCLLDGGPCALGTTCCGNECCGSTQSCCWFNGSGGTGNDGPYCHNPSGSDTTCGTSCCECASDRNLKHDIERVDDDAILETLATLPISTWSYKSDDPAVRHMGPMAQDFRAAFGLGDTDRAYNPIDAHGVTFAAIKALYERLKRDEARTDALERENARLREECTRARPGKGLP